MSDLTQAMAINKPSLYGAYGNKEQLFMSALEQYVRHYSFPSLDHLFAPDEPLDHRLYAYLKSVSLMLCRPDLPTGCMLVNSTCESAGDGVPEASHKLVSAFNQKAKQHLTDFFIQEKEIGTIKSQSSPLALALFLMSVTSGMAILARNGATSSELDEMIEHVVTTIV